MNINVFVSPRCRLEWQLWNARGLFLDTCDKFRIRKRATPNHRLAQKPAKKTYATSEPTPPIQPSTSEVAAPAKSMALLRLESACSGPVWEHDIRLFSQASPAYAAKASNQYILELLHFQMKSNHIFPH